MDAKTPEQVQADGERLRNEAIWGGLVALDRYARWQRERGAVEALRQAYTQAVRNGWLVQMEALNEHVLAAIERRDAIASEA